MASEEYLDLYLQAQNNPNALYHVISFDVVNSKTIPPEKRKILQQNIFIIIKYVYEKLLEKEADLGKQVVIKDKRFYRPWDDNVSHKNGNFMDPLIFGDCFQFTVLRDTVSKEEIIEWVNECLISLNMEEKLHISDGYYETNEYLEGNIKYYRGYCLQTLERIHKPSFQKYLKRIQNR